MALLSADGSIEMIVRSSEPNATAGQTLVSLVKDHEESVESVAENPSATAEEGADEEKAEKVSRLV